MPIESYTLIYLIPFAIRIVQAPSYPVIGIIPVRRICHLQRWP